MYKILPIIISTIIFLSPVYADIGDATQDTQIDYPTISGGLNINLSSIRIPLFISLEHIQNFSIFSYISLAANVFFLALFLYWVYLVVQAGLSYIRSEGSSDMIGESTKKFGNVVWSIAFLVGFFVILSLVSAFIGVGNVWDWPKSFSKCQDDSFYYTVYAKGISVGLTEEQIDNLCFNNVIP